MSGKRNARLWDEEKQRGEIGRDIDGGSFSHDPAGAKNVKGVIGRNRLISKMLQDRGTLRLVSAPHGFGKTCLAREYANRFFEEGAVCWIDGTDPKFLVQLDHEALVAVDDEKVGLCVIDAVPWLHEARAATLVKLIDRMLAGSKEVVVTMVPSHDCLSAIMSDCVRISAHELLVSEREFFASNESSHGPLSGKSKKWEEFQRMFMGRVPAVVWGDSDDGQRLCLAALFSESLPLGCLGFLFDVLVLGSCSLKDLDALGRKISNEDLAFFADEYPVMGIDMIKRTCAPGYVSLSLLKEALTGNNLADDIVNAQAALSYRLLDKLFRSDKCDRAGEYLDVFCPPDQQLWWLHDRGWELIDRGKVHLVSRLLTVELDRSLRESRKTCLLQAFTAGLMGERREASRYARKALLSTDGEREEDLARLALARVALCAFDRGGDAVFGIAQLEVGEAPQAPEEFLACVVTQLDDAQLLRGCSIDALGSEEDTEQKECDLVEAQIDALERLCIYGSERFPDTIALRLSLHLIAQTNSARLRSLLLNLGCDIVMSTRRNGIKCFSEALVLRDLWRAGYFSPAGSVGDVRNIRLFNQARQVLHEVGALSGALRVDIPWDKDGLSGSDIQPGVAALQDHDGIDLVHVRLFGSFEVMVGGKRADETAWRRKARTMLTLLALAQGRDVPRDELLEELWPRVSRVRALDNFYTLWNKVQRALGDGPYIERRGEFCRINPRYVTVDITEFERLSRAMMLNRGDTDALLDTYARIEALYRGDLVPSESDSMSLNAARDRYRATYVDAMISATHCSVEEGDARVALWFARKAMSTGERREDVYFALMKAQVAAGQRCSAIKTFYACKEFLREDLGLDPSIETQELYDTLVTTDPSLLKLKPGTFIF